MEKNKTVVARVADLPLRSLRVYAGFWALAYDVVSGVWQDPADFFDRVERRGLRMEKVINRRLQTIEERSSHELRRLSDGAMMPIKWVKQEVVEGSHLAEDEVERQVERVLERLGIPTRERLERLSHEIEALTAKIDTELLHYGETEQAAERSAVNP